MMDTILATCITAIFAAWVGHLKHQLASANGGPFALETPPAQRHHPSTVIRPHSTKDASAARQSAPQRKPVERRTAPRKLRRPTRDTNGVATWVIE